MPSARDHPFNQSRRPLLEFRSNQLDNGHHPDDDEEENEDYADYADICNNNRPTIVNSSAMADAYNNNSSPSPIASNNNGNCNFKTYGFTRKFGKANNSAEPTLLNNGVSPLQQHKKKVYNGFNDFNSIPRVCMDEGYPYGEKIINNQRNNNLNNNPNNCKLTGFRELSDNDFVFSDNLVQANNLKNCPTPPQQQQYRRAQPQQLNQNQNSRKLHPNQLNGNCSPNDDYRYKPLPKAPSPLQRRSPPASPPLANNHSSTQSPVTPHRTGPFIFGVDSNSHSSLTTSQRNSPTSNHRHQINKLDSRQSPTVIDHRKYSNNINAESNGHSLVRRQKNQKTVNGDAPENTALSRDNQKRRKSPKGKKSDKACGGDSVKKTGKSRDVGRQVSRIPSVKCVVVGDGAVGKTNLIISYLQNRFLQEHNPTASDIYNGEVEVDGEPVNVTLCDTAGQDTLDALRELCYPDSDVFLVCFSVVNPQTFRSVQTKWIPKLSKQKGASVILVGTHGDLRDDQNTITWLQIQGEKPVSMTDAAEYARSIGAKYIESSSRTKYKVKEAFDTAIWDALLSQQSIRRRRPLWRRLFCCGS